MLATCAEWAQAARLALVIGNDAYLHLRTLKKAGGDATTMASELGAAGFSVVNEQRYQRNLDRRGMYGQLEVLKTRIRPGDEVVVFFSGHGAQVGASSYLLPVDFPYPANEQTFLDEGIALQRFMDDVKAGGARFSLFIIDACRENPLPPRAGTKSIGLSRGLNLTQEPAEGQMVLFAAGKDQTALDRLSENDPDPNGVFTRVLVKHLRRPDVPVISLFAEVQEEVEKLALTYIDPDTKRPHRQLPAFYNETRLKKDPFCLRISKGCPRLAGLSTDTASATVRVQSAEEVEQEYWNGIRESRDTRDFEQYLKLYPSGRFVALARQKLKADSPGTGTAVATPAPVALPQRPSVASEPAPPTKPQYAPPSVSRDCPECPEMVVILVGGFEMGSQEEEVGHRKNEEPVHHVQIGKPFALGRTEVTVGEFRAFVRATSYRSDAEKNAGDESGCHTYNKDDGTGAGRHWDNPGFSQNERHPVVCVSWSDVKAYVTWLQQKTGKDYRLPSEAEWEYAARGGTQTARYWGNNPNEACRYANVRDTTTAPNGGKLRNGHECGDGYFFTAPVGSFVANSFGLYDVIGNVSEFVKDCAYGSYRGAPSDGGARICEGEGVFVQRGGSWSAEPPDARVATRYMVYGSDRSSRLGFRVARTLP